MQEQKELLFSAPCCFGRSTCRSTFPFQDDPVHFDRITLSVDDYADWLKKEYDRRRWFTIATWHKAPPSHTTQPVEVNG